MMMEEKELEIMDLGTDVSPETFVQAAMEHKVGDTPVTETFCHQIGADACTPDAASAADVAGAYCPQNLLSTMKLIAGEVNTAGMVSPIGSVEAQVLSAPVRFPDDKAPTKWL